MVLIILDTSLDFPYNAQYVQYIEDLDRRSLKTYYLAKENLCWSIVILTDHGGCKKSDLDQKQRTKYFDSINFVSGQVEKGCKGVHGLDIPQHKTVIFKIFNGPIETFVVKDKIMGRLTSRIHMIGIS